MIGFSPIESGVAACVLDDLTGPQAAQALGVPKRRAQRLLRAMQDRFGARTRAGLAMELVRVEARHRHEGLA